MPVVLLGFAYSDEAGPEVDLGRVADIIALNAEAVRRTASCTVLRSRVFVLLPGADQLSSERIQQFLTASQRAVSGAAGADLRCAYSGPLDNVTDLDRAHRDIETAFRFQSIEALGTSICTEDERHRILLQELSEGTVAAPDRLLTSVRRILDYDAENGTEYASTLLAFLDTFGDNRRAAEITMVHENSQRYRMRQLTKRFGIDLDDPALRLITWLQLYLHRREMR
jgi:DNA-binding PucR family transcriptional regulator